MRELILSALLNPSEEVVFRKDRGTFGSLNSSDTVILDAVEMDARGSRVCAITELLALIFIAKSPCVIVKELACDSFAQIVSFRRQMERTSPARSGDRSRNTKDRQQDHSFHLVAALKVAEVLSLT